MSWYQYHYNTNTNINTNTNTNANANASVSANNNSIDINNNRSIEVVFETIDGELTTVEAGASRESLFVVTPSRIPWFQPKSRSSYVLMWFNFVVYLMPFRMLMLMLMLISTPILQLGNTNASINLKTNINANYWQYSYQHVTVASLHHSTFIALLGTLIMHVLTSRTNTGISPRLELHCIVLYRGKIVLYCIVLYPIELYRIEVNCIVSNCNVSNLSELYCSVSYYIGVVFYCIAMYRIVLCHLYRIVCI